MTEPVPLRQALTDWWKATSPEVPELAPQLRQVFDETLVEYGCSHLHHRDCGEGCPCWFGKTGGKVVLHWRGGGDVHEDH